jgi:hypothetical protein
MANGGGYALKDIPLNQSEYVIVSEGDQEQLKYLQSNDFKYIDGFYTDRIRAYDPINKKLYDDVYVGKTYRASNKKNYTHWRYITVYNNKKVETRMQNFMAITEECHDKGWNIGSWNQTNTFSVSLTSQASVEAMGIGASVSLSLSAGVTFSVQKPIQGTQGLKATHVPYQITEDQAGITYIQVLLSNNKIGYIVKLAELNSFIRFLGLYSSTGSETTVPMSSGSSYPFKFKLTNQNPTFRAKRENVSYCSGYKSPQSAQADVDIFTK